MNGKFGGGNGSSTSPYLIEDADDLNAIRNYPSSYFKMVNDVNLGNGKYNTGQGWNPVNKFTGGLDGDNHKILNLYINRPTEDCVGFFRQYCCGINNVIFVDPEIIGHNYVGVIFGHFMADMWNVPVSNVNNVSICNALVSGNFYVGGLAGALSLLGHDWRTGGISSVFSNVYVDVHIQAKDAIACGIGRSGSGIVPTLNCDCANVVGYRENCNCNCKLYNIGSWLVSVCSSTGTSNNGYGTTNFYHSVTFRNCIVKLHKDPSITTYYAITNGYYSYASCYVDNAEFAPIVASGIEYKDLSNIDYSTNILPNVNHNLFKKEPEANVEPLNLNKDSIYFKIKDGYVVYNFTTEQWEMKYTHFNNQNSIKIVQNGMNRTALSKIPSNKLKELQDENSKIKIVNCINAHEKIVSKSETIEVNKFKEFVNKNIFKNKIKFNKYNDKIMSIVKQ